MNSGQQPWASDPVPDSPLADAPLANSHLADAPPEKQPRVAGPIPLWAWAFVLACIAIPVSTMGGPLWIVLGTCSAFACTNVARDETRPLKTRLAQCGAITLICWILFLLIVGGISRMQGR
jgi:hypothetical protein